MNRVHLRIIPAMLVPAGMRAQPECGRDQSSRPMPIHLPRRHSARLCSSAGEVGQTYMPGTQTCVFIGASRVQCPAIHTYAGAVGGGGAGATTTGGASFFSTMIFFSVTTFFLTNLFFFTLWVTVG